MSKYFSKFTIIDDTDESRDKFGRFHGGYEYELSENDIQALYDGKALAGSINDDEFSVFITLTRKGQ